MSRRGRGRSNWAAPWETATFKGWSNGKPPASAVAEPVAAESTRDLTNLRDILGLLRGAGWSYQRRFEPCHGSEFPDGWWKHRWSRGEQSIEVWATSGRFVGGVDYHDGQEGDDDGTGFISVGTDWVAREGLVKLVAFGDLVGVFRR